jgi:hypothetical protein
MKLDRRLPSLLGPLLCACSAAVLPRAAAEPSVALKVETQTAYANEALPISIEISGFREAAEPVLPDIPNCTVRAAGGPADMSQLSIINGLRTESRTRTYHYELTPQAVGQLVIPSIAVQVDGQTLRTTATKIRVLASETDTLFAAEVSLGRARLYVGQRVQATLTIWVKPPFYGSQRLEPGYVLRSISPINFGPFPREISNASNVGRMRTIDGKQETYYAYDFVTPFVPEKPGRLSFDDIEVGIAYPTRTGTRNLRAHAGAPPIEVLPVPVEGRPPGFVGAVGLYDIKAYASPTSVRVGDPIGLTLEVFGDGPVETLPPPLLSANQPLMDGFRVPDETLAGEMKNGRRRFTVTIRAKRDNITEIPPIEYPYFDPDAERFVVAKTEAIPLTVTPAAEVEAPEITRPTTPSPGTATPLEALDGLRDIETHETALLATKKPIAPGAVTAIMFVPPAVFLLTWAGVAFVQSRAADPARRRRQAALRNARRRIAAAQQRPPHELAGEIAAALAGYLADRLNEPPGRFTGQAAVDFLRARGLSAGVVDQWSAVVAGCEETTFAGGARADLDGLARQALACLTALEHVKL